MTIEDLLISAVQIVRDAGQIAKRGFGDSPIVRVKPRSDIVTEGDLQVEEYVSRRLQQLYPDHGFDSEEAGVVRRGAEYRWVLDPIDGTKYYSRGVPLYSISLALQRRAELILGVVFFPEPEQMFCAGEGRGAELNRQPIRCSAAERLDEATIRAEIPSRDSPAEDRRWAMQKLALLVDRVQRVRIMGLAPFGLCFTATGGFDAYVNLGSSPKYCDIAAGQVIVKEAGGTFSHVNQAKVAGPSALCEQLLDLLDLPHDPSPSNRETRFP